MHSPSWWQQCSGVDASQIEVLDFFIFFILLWGTLCAVTYFFPKFLSLNMSSFLVKT